MKILRLIAVTLVAGLLGSLLPSWAAQSEAITFWQFTLPFTLFGSFAFLLPTYATAYGNGLSAGQCYGLTVAIGLLAGALMLLPLSWEPGLMLVGALYGGLTGVFWVALHWFTGWRLSGASKEENLG